MLRPRLVLSIAIPLAIFLLPRNMIPISGLTVVEHRLIAIFTAALLFWIFEPIPVFATSVLVVVLELLTISDAGFIFFRADAGAPAYGTLLSYREIMATFASPIIMLFLGGFFLAMAATKFQLDTNLARVLLKPFGSNPKFVLLGLMLITAFFSMFMSNTATTAMMLAILAPVLRGFDVQDRGRIAFALGIPFAANVGGIGTPIGTPPNAIALKYLTGANRIEFGEWMSFAAPLAIALLLFTWLLLLILHRPETKVVRVEIQTKFRRNWQAWTVYLTFSTTILLWLSGFLHGMNSYVVAMIPVAVFTATGIITVQDLKSISWDVLWLVAGGIALGLALEQSGLANRLIEAIPFSTLAPHAIVLLATVITIVMANFMSNTATANLLMPIVAVLGSTLPGLEAIGGSTAIIVVTAFACSLAMCLPISTPPNAMAHATGAFKTHSMMRAGALVGAVGLVAAYVVVYIAF